jgi:hypothetical protein
MVGDSLNQSSRTGYALTRAVAAIYRTLGARVAEEVSLAGNQVDLLVTLRDATGGEVRCAVECKAYSKLIGLGTVSAFDALAHLLRSRSLIDKAVLISINGFTKRAQAFAKEHSIELIMLSDLQDRLRGREEEVVKQVESGFEEEARLARTQTTRKQVFVIMPFAREFDDVYILGIREVAEKMGLVVERADDVEHNGQILEVIQQKIRDYHLVVADTTLPNPNVFYEVGYAHASGTPTILVARSGGKPPFDVQSFNHIFYETIVDLRDKLEKRIRTTLGLE